MMLYRLSTSDPYERGIFRSVFMIGWGLLGAFLITLVVCPWMVHQAEGIDWSTATSQDAITGLWLEVMSFEMVAFLWMGVGSALALMITAGWEFLATRRARA